MNTRSVLLRESANRQTDGQTDRHRVKRNAYDGGRLAANQKQLSILIHLNTL